MGASAQLQSDPIPSSENVDELSQSQEKLQLIESKELGKPFEYEAHWRSQTRKDDLGLIVHQKNA